MNEFEDYDLDLREKEALVEEASKLAETEDLADALRQANSLQRRWKRTHGSESIYEEELKEKFEGFMDKVYAKRGEIMKASETVKSELVAKAKEVSEMANFVQSSKLMNELMNEWKSAGSAGKDKDDELWAQFNEIRQAYFAKKNEFFANREVLAKEAKEKKTALVEKAKELAASVEWKKATDGMNELMEAWKSAGRAGKEEDDTLWAEFSAARKAFFDARGSHYKELQATYSERLAKKMDVINEAKELVASGDFSRATTDKVKALRASWKEIGFAGKEKDDEVWALFNETVNSYFDKLKSVNAQKREDWVARMEDSIGYKLEQIEREKKQIIRIRANAKESLRESAVAEAEEEVAEKEMHIKQLEAEIAEIKDRVNK